MVQEKQIPTYAGLERPAIFAHRGASAYAPENTLAAIKLAILQRADAIELDARLCADGHVVVHHDETVDRTTDGSGRISSMTLDEIKQLDAGSKFSSEFKSERIPTLEEVFEAVGNRIVINIELKNLVTPSDDLPEKVTSLVSKYNLEKSVILSSFNPIALIRARFLLPKIPFALLTTEGMAPIALYSRLVRFGRLLALHSKVNDVTPELVRKAHEAKCLIRAYTINQPETMRQLFKIGVDGIFTDDPLSARNVLDEIKERQIELERSIN